MKPTTSPEKVLPPPRFRESILRVTVGFDGVRTVRRDVYVSTPFKVANVSEDRSDPALYMTIMSAAPGILDGDQYDMRITAESGSRLRLQTQSYQRLFNMKTGAQQKLVVTLDPGSELSFIPHPMVPHTHSIFRSHSQLHLADNCLLTYGEILTCGRKLSGEVFRFKRLHNCTEVYHNQRLLVKDNILMQPGEIDITAMGQTEGFTHQATLIHVTTRRENANAEAMRMHELLGEESDIQYGLSQPHPNVVMLRVLGNGGEQLLDAFRRIEAYLWKLNAVR